LQRNVATCELNHELTFRREVAAKRRVQRPDFGDDHAQFLAESVANT
jgi:hypothetical protein